MNSVYLYVEDCTGTRYLDTFTHNTPEAIASFRKHAEWWKRYVRTPAGRKAYVGSYKGAPCFPVRIVVEEYDDKTSN